MPRHLRPIRGLALKEQGYRCFYCKAPLKPLDATADHKHPKSRRGKTYQGNIVAACRACNAAKQDLFDAEFFTKINKAKPPKGASPELLLIWASRRIWRKTHRACERIEALTAL